MPYGRLCALPYWANNINDPAEQMGVLVAILGSKQLEAIDALEAIRLHVSATRILIGGGVSQDLIAERLAKLYETSRPCSGRSIHERRRYALNPIRPRRASRI